MSNQEEKYALCYHAMKKAMANTYHDLMTVIQKGNPNGIPDPKLQLQFLGGWMQVIQGIEDSYGIDKRDQIIN
jgi:hypothetical protein